MLQLEIPIHEKVSANKIYSGLNHWHRTRLKDDYHSLVLSEVRKMEKKSGTKLHADGAVSIDFAFGWKGRVLDCSNCFFMAKMIEDGLVKAGVLKDDSPDYVEGLRVTSVKGISDFVCVYIRGEGL
jgi:hypothetical protein